MTARNDLLKQIAKYLRDEADFNLSWTDGRRSADAVSQAYIDRRLDVFAERIIWAEAVESAQRELAGFPRDEVPR